MAEIWDNAWLTNEGPIFRRFTARMAEYLQTPNVWLYTNGTLALQIGLQALGLTGDVITTPFSFVATTHALHWNRLRPVFADIEPDYYTLDPSRVEAAITPDTTAILAVHVYGYPCDLPALRAIADQHGLRLIYDAAHAFGVTVDGTPLVQHGDLSMLSLHATKLFHSIEGGALIFHDPEMGASLRRLANFGFADETQVVEVGTNAKMNEFQALMGLQLLDYMEQITATRRALAAVYRARLMRIPGLRLPPNLPAGVCHNYAYQPVEVIGGAFPMSRDALYAALRTYNIYSRRYFCPLIPDFACYRDSCANADPLTTARRVAEQILCLPIHHDLSEDDVHRICDIIAALASQ